MTDMIGLVFWKDTGPAVQKEDEWDVGPHEQQGGQLGTPSTWPEASTPRHPSTPPRGLKVIIAFFWLHSLSSKMQGIRAVD